MTPFESTTRAKQKEEAKRKMEELRRNIKKSMSIYTSPSEVDHYNKWIHGYIKNGGKPTHWYDYPMERLEFRTAHSDFHLPKAYGASSVRLIVPVGVKVTFDQLGHNWIYFMDGYHVEGGIIPVFSNTVDIEERG